MRAPSFTLGILTFAALTLCGASSAGFSDVPANSPYAQAISDLQTKSVVNGYGDGTFKPDALVNRAEFLQMVMAARAKPNNKMPLSTRYCFTDFATGPEQWFWQAACLGKAEGIVQGNPDGSFRGANTVNLAEALAMSVRAWDIPEPVYIRAPDHWYDPFMIAAEGHTSVFNVLPKEPGRLLSRAETAAVIDAFMQSSVVICNGHSLGDSYPSSDGCNVCSCTDHGEICTMRACVQKTCYSSKQCPASQVCTTEDGVCTTPPCPPDQPNCVQPMVCMGVCRMK